MSTSLKEKSIPGTFSHEDDNEYSIQMARWFLKPIGSWPRTASTSYTETILSILSITICYATLFVAVIPCSLYIILEEENRWLQLRAFGPLSFWLATIIKYTMLLTCMGGIQKCLEHINEDWKNVKCEAVREIMLQDARIGRYIAGCCVTFMHCGSFAYDLVRCFIKTKVQVGNESIPMRMLPLPFYNGIVDTHSSPEYEIIFGMQCVSTFVVNSVNAGACSVAAIFVMHACGQLHVVMSWLEKNVHDSIAFQEQEIEIVECHLRAISFVSQIEDLMNGICFLEVILCTMDMCLLGYYCILEFEQREMANLIGYPIVFIAFTFNIFIFCYIGEIISEQCRQVGEVAYTAKWYMLPEKKALDFILIISRSRFVVQLTAGKIIQLSIPTFSSVIKTSVAYLNILRQVI